MEKFLSRIVLIFLLVIIVVLPQTSDAQEDKVSDRQDVSWNELIFNGSKLMNQITVKIQLISGDKLSGDQSTKMENSLIECSETSHGSTLLAVQSSSKGLGSSEKYNEEIWFDEMVISPEKRIRIDSGGDPWVKSYCWEDNGVRRLKILPGTSSEKKQPPSKWTKRSESFYEYPADAAECATISDPSLVFYMLSTLDLERQKEPIEICVFGRKQLHRVTIGQEKPSSLKVAYKERSSSGEVAVKDKINPVVFSITTEVFSSAREKTEAYSFLGLNKDIRIFMDPEKRLPVKISGTNNSIGELVLELKVHSK